MLHGGSTNPCGDVTPWGRRVELFLMVEWPNGEVA